MPGYFSYPFEDDEATGFFGGYRRPTRSLSDPTVDANDVPVSDTLPPPNAPGGTSNILTLPDGKPVIDVNTDQPYPQPDRLNMQDNIATGQAISRLADNPRLGDLSNPDLMFAPLFVHGSEMDYQRPLGHPFGPFKKAYKNLSSYNFGVVGAAAGYNLERLLNGAALYAKYSGTSSNETPYGLTNEQTNNIAQGFSDYTNGLWTQRPSE